MERWAANTLRTLGIILTAGFVLITSLLLALMSLCAANGGLGGNRHPDQVLPYAAGAVFVLIIGIVVTTQLARGIFRSTGPEPLASQPVDTRAAAPSEAPSPTAPANRSLPVHLSPLGRRSIDRLVFVLAAQILVSALAWIVNQLTFWRMPHALAPHNWTLLLLAPFVLYHIPYAILIYALIKRPDRIAFTYSIAVPAVLILQSMFSLTVVTYYYVHHPAGFFLLVIPWAIHIVVLVLAYQAIQQVGIHPQPASLIVAAVVTFFFLSLIHVATPFLYRSTWR